MKIAYLVAISMAIFALSSLVSLGARSFTVGVSPGTIDIGDLAVESTKLVDFYITTPSDEAMLVKLEAERGELSFFNKPDYRDLIYNCSEEDATSWVEVINNPVEIRPGNVTLKTEGGLIRGKEQISFLINVPKDAEPGYHVLYIKPTPSATSEATGTVGSRVVAVTSIGTLFNIPGNAIRKGVILETETGDYVGDRLEIKTYFQNTGTTTISADATQKIYNESGELVKELYAGKSYVKPKEIKVFKTMLPTTGLSLGDYDVFTSVDYTTDKSEKVSTVTLSVPSPKTLEAKQEESSAILFIFIIVIFIVSMIIYKRTK